MKKCTGCRKEKEEQEFINNNKILVKCNECRIKLKEWKNNNKQRIKFYNEAYRNNNIENWKEIKQENKIIDNLIGQPSKHRILHETIDDIIGKKCCTCKEWFPLTNYNFSKNHWDNLRNDCKECLMNWRKNNRKQMTEKHKEYEKNRKKIDPKFKLIKTLRSRLKSALKRKNIEKGFSTMELTGCELPFLKGYLEAKFTEGMTWENHGDWHLDHIIPCCSFNLENEEEQKKCFHYTNLQPLWAKDNLSKGGKII
jgi:hypothetical protein